MAATFAGSLAWCAVAGWTVHRSGVWAIVRGVWRVASAVSNVRDARHEARVREYQNLRA